MNFSKRMLVIAVELFVLAGFLLLLAGRAFVLPGAASSPWFAAWPDLVIGVILLLVAGELLSLVRHAPSVPAPLLP